MVMQSKLGERKRGMPRLTSRLMTLETGTSILLAPAIEVFQTRSLEETEQSTAECTVLVPCHTSSVSINIAISSPPSVAFIAQTPTATQS
jgi:hypothetical protein